LNFESGKNISVPPELLAQSHTKVEMGYVTEFDSQKISDFKPFKNLFWVLKHTKFNKWQTNFIPQNVKRKMQNIPLINPFT
jgi:hypothetical protein